MPVLDTRALKCVALVDLSISPRAPRISKASWSRHSIRRREDPAPGRLPTSRALASSRVSGRQTDP